MMGKNGTTWLKMLVVLMVVIGLSMGFNGIAFAGSLEPSGPPGSTMKTLDEIPPTWSQILPVAERFDLVLGGAAVLDKETGLVWEQSPSTTPTDWGPPDCLNKVVGNRKGWRHPAQEELLSLVDPTQSNPALPSGHPFTGVQSDIYWSGTTTAFSTSNAGAVDFSDGGMIMPPPNKTTGSHYVWCVRGGNGKETGWGF